MFKQKEEHQIVLRTLRSLFFLFSFFKQFQSSQHTESKLYMLKSFVISEQQPVGMVPLWRTLGRCNGFLRIVEVHNPIHIQEHVGKLLALLKTKFILFPQAVTNKVGFIRGKKDSWQNVVKPWCCGIPNPSRFG